MNIVYYHLKLKIQYQMCKVQKNNSTRYIIHQKTYINFFTNILNKDIIFILFNYFNITS